jgi:hypothetical protein
VVSRPDLAAVEKKEISLALSGNRRTTCAEGRRSKRRMLRWMWDCVMKRLHRVHRIAISN